MNNNLSKQIIVVVLVLAVIVVAAALWWKRASVERAADLAAVNQALTPNSAAEAVALKIDDQFPGPFVFVSNVVLPNGGWVAIHSDDSGAPGAIAGVGYFDKGLATGEINLSQPSVEGQIYHAVLYRDSDANIMFDPNIDTVIRDSTNLPVRQIFHITKNLPENKG